MDQHLAALLLQLDWGADEAIGDEKLDRLTQAVPARQANRPQMPADVARLQTVPAASPKATSVDALLAELAAFEGCALRATAMQFVRPDGNAQAPLIVIGDAPGSDDDRSGRAFSGATGQLLDRVLASAGLGRDMALLTTLVPWRPPGNRKPTEREIQACLPFVYRLLEIVRPRHALLLGVDAVRTLAREEMSIRRLRGRWLQLQVHDEQLTIPALALPTPDQWLSNAAAKQRLWSDLIVLRKAVTTV